MAHRFIPFIRRAAGFPGAAWRGFGCCMLVCVCAVLSSPLSAAETFISVDEALVEVGESGTFNLPFLIQRDGDLADGVRLRVETAPGGANPGIPGVDYVPVPAGTEVLMPAGVSDTMVNVDVFGLPAGTPDRTLLLQLSEARAFNPEPRLQSVAMRYGVCCQPRRIKLADLNGNGHDDMVVSTSLATVSVLLADGAGGYLPPVELALPDGDLLLPRATDVAVADVTGNGHPDIVLVGHHSGEVVVYAGDGEGGFSGPQAFDAGEDRLPWTVAVADVTGNGHLDIITGGGDFSVLEGDGTGNLAAPVFHGIGILASFNDMLVADVTGNGHPDLVGTTSALPDLSPGVVILLPGLGGGAFGAPVHLAAGPLSQPIALAAGDVTGNGHTDLVIGNQTRGADPRDPPFPTAAILEGDGTGGFAEAMLHPVDAVDIAGDVVLGDVTGNGHIDIMLALPMTHRVAVLLGKGQGAFATPIVVPTGRSPWSIALADVTLDGHADLLTADLTGESISVLLGDGTGNFGLPGHYPVGVLPDSLAVADLNGNGLQDVVAAGQQSNNVAVLLNDGLGGFAHKVEYPVGVTPRDVIIADVDGDGIADLITANAGSNDISVLLGQGDGSFSQPAHYSVGQEFQGPVTLAAGDVNGNGHNDIVVANWYVGGDSIAVLPGDGSGTFPESMLFPVGDSEVLFFHNPHSVLLIDVTGNGHLDIVTGTNATPDPELSLSVLAGDGQGNFTHAGYLPGGLGSTTDVAAADVTGNGHADLIVLNHSDHSVSVLAGDGAGGFAQPVTFPIFPAQSNEDLAPWPWGLTVGDVTGDGYLDIVTANTQNSTASVLVNDGSGNFPTLQFFDTGTAPGSVVVADVTGDGNMDVITANRASGTVTVLASALSRVVMVGDQAVGTISTGATGPGPDFSVMPTAIDFGEHMTGETAGPEMVTITNNGLANLEVTDISEPGGPFARSGGSCQSAPFLLVPRDACTVGYVFSPASEGPFNTAIRVTVEGGSADVALSGTGIGGTGPGKPVVQFPEGAVLDFGLVTTFAERDVVLSNAGESDLMVAAITGPQVPFTVVAGNRGLPACAAAPFTLAPGTSCFWTIRFEPSGPGGFEDTLTVVSNAASSPDTVSLAGTGAGGEVPPAAVAIPTLGGHAMVVLILMLLLAGGFRCLRRG